MQTIPKAWHSEVEEASHIGSMANETTAQTNGSAMFTRWSQAVTLVAICLGYFMTILDVAAVNVALPDMQHDLGARWQVYSG